ncbi:MAG: RNA polymerase sigma factor, partial [Candidatus Binatia bacterium]
HETAQSEATQTLPSPEARSEERELQRLVWDAAATLNPRDYSVFELAVRHGLGSREIAHALDVRPAYAYILTNRLKSSVAEALEVLLLVRLNRTSCVALDELVSAYGDEPTPRLRKAVSRHARSCEVCTASKERRASVPALLQGTAFAEPASAFKEALGQRLRDDWKTPTVAAGTGLATIAATVVAVIVGAGVLTGALAQRTITEIEEFPGQEFPAQAEFDGEGIEDVLATNEPEPAVAPRPLPQPTPHVVVVTDGVSQGEDAVETEESTEPPETESPPTRPPPRQEPTIR